MYIIIKRNVTNAQYVGSNTPSVHPDLTKAQAEAERLAIANPHWEFIICQGITALLNQPRIIQRNI